MQCNAKFMKHGMLKDGAVGESPFLGFWFNFVEGCAVQVQRSKGSMFNVQGSTSNVRGSTSMIRLL